MTHDELFTAERSRLLTIAYNMLGQVADAEDVVQDTYLRWHALADRAIDNPPGLLTTMVTRVAIDRLRVAKREREHYVGPWLPEPVIDGSDLAERVIMDERVSYALLATLERLSPVERAVFLLRDVFDYDYADIAQVIEKSPDNCRQIAVRARQHLGNAKVRRRPSAREARRLQLAFARAIRSGDVARITRLLVGDAILYSDGGPDTSAARKPIFGALNIAKLWLGLAKKADPSLSVRFCTVNGAPAYRTDLTGQPHSVVVLDTDGWAIDGIWMVTNPDKLKRVGPTPPPPLLERLIPRLAGRSSRGE